MRGRVVPFLLTWRRMRNTKRLILLLVLGACAVLGACVEAREVDTPMEPPVTLRELLADEVQVEIDALPEAGTIGVAKRYGGKWMPVPVPLEIEGGALRLSADNAAIGLEAVSIQLAPIALPEDLLGQTAELAQIEITLRTPVQGTTTWVGNEQARVRFEAPLELSWSLALADTVIPIGAPRFDPIPFTVTLDADGHVVEARASLGAMGELWSWAGLLQLSNLQLGMTAVSD
jgi:hypothetical protein